MDNSLGLRHYAPDVTAPGEPQRLGQPRPGYGTVYVRTEGGTPRYPEISWVASWVDDYDRPNDRGEVAGVENFEGSRAEVLAWARTRPAANRLIPGPTDWIPLPAGDDDVRIRGEA